MRLKLKHKKAAKKKTNSRSRSSSNVPEVMKVLPEVVPGAVNIPFTPEELLNYAQLLSVMSQGLEQMALDAAKLNNNEAVDILTARSQLSAVLAGKLSSHYIIGESPSRSVH